MKAKLVIDWNAETLWFYNREGVEVGFKHMTSEDIEALEFYGVDFDTLAESATLDLEDVYEEAGGAWDEPSAFLDLADKALA